MRFDAGHYVCAIRDASGEFWLFDDDRDPVRLGGDIAHVRQREVYMLVYTRRGGVARWDVPCVLEPEAEVGIAGSGSGNVRGSGDGDDREGLVRASPRRRLLRKVSSDAVATPRRRLLRKTTSIASLPSHAPSPVIRWRLQRNVWPPSKP